MRRKDASRNEIALTFLFFSLTIITAFGASYLCVSDPFFRSMITLARQSELLANRYYGEVAPDRVFDDAWRGMQRAVPFHVELSDWPDSGNRVPKVRDWGLTLTSLDSTILVVDVALSSPFHGALIPQDRITQIDELRYDELNELFDYLNNENRTEMCVHYERNGRADSTVVELRRDQIDAGRMSETFDSVRYISFDARSLADLFNEFGTDQDLGIKAFIFDLRGSHLDDASQVSTVVDKIWGMIGHRPSIVLVDAGTKGASEEIARELTEVVRSVSMGAPTAGAISRIEEIGLRSGRKLYVSRDQINITDSFSSKTIDTIGKANPPIKTGIKNSNAVIPETLCDQLQISPLVFDLIHRGIILDFVTESMYAELPKIEEEAKLYEDFKRFVKNRKYRYDPLVYDLDELGLYKMDSDMRALYRSLRSTHQSLGEVTLDEYHDEIVRGLLRTIHKVKIGGDPPFAVRMRTEDPCLAQAYQYLKDHSE